LNYWLLLAESYLTRRLFGSMKDCGVTITKVLHVACQRAGSEYSLTVHDSGPGIPAEAQEKIFERFFRLDPARTQNRRALGTAETAAPATTGAGLGLAIARWIAEAHHGQLVLVHSDASGSTFAAFLPANGAAAAESTDATHPMRESTS
jgi:signal transduction histidine kinase